ncbi:MAG: hypothetical protein QG588_55, partial [Candidatus Poribacteria bacterium]|nr:hypothetical protein [Candidatus Poribacteria bacterium]
MISIRNNPNLMLLCILGPTAVGKTEIAIK